MANPYTGGNDVNPFADDARRAPAAQPAPAASQPQFYNPPSSAAAQSPAYHPPANEFHQQPTYGSAAPQQQYQPPQQYAQQPPPPHQQQYGGQQDPNLYAQQPPPQQQYQGPVEQGPPPPPARDLQTMKFWTIEFYQQFFDVDTVDVLRRMGNVMLPFTPPDFLLHRDWHHAFGGALSGRLAALSSTVSHKEGVQERMPDLYGPIWLSTTLWILIGIIGNAMSKLAHTKSKSTDSWSYDFTVATVAAGTVYAYVGLMSLMIWGIMKWKAVPASLPDVLCLYGYSMFIIILAAILCSFPNTGVQWFVCIAAGLWSGTYLLANFWQLWKRTLNQMWFTGVVLLVIFFHFLLTCSLKFYFFNYKS